MSPTPECLEVELRSRHLSRAARTPRITTVTAPEGEFTGEGPSPGGHEVGEYKSYVSTCKQLSHA